jgi:hypothetical protein
VVDSVSILQLVELHTARRPRDKLASNTESASARPHCRSRRVQWACEGGPWLVTPPSFGPVLRGRTIREEHPPVDMAHHSPNGRGPDVQPFGELFGRDPAGEQAKDLHLSRCERLADGIVLVASLPTWTRANDSPRVPGSSSRRFVRQRRTPSPNAGCGPCGTKFWTGR